MLAYPIGSTLSGYGDVTRGLCRIRDGKLVSVTEMPSVRRGEDGLVQGFASGVPETIDPGGPGLDEYLRLCARGARPVSGGV